MKTKLYKHFLLSGMLVFSDKIISSEESRDIKRWIMMTKVGQLFEEEKLAYAKEESERTKKEMAVKMLQKAILYVKLPISSRGAVS